MAQRGGARHRSSRVGTGTAQRARHEGDWCKLGHYRTQTRVESSTLLLMGGLVGRGGFAGTADGEAGLPGNDTEHSRQELDRHCRQLSTRWHIAGAFPPHSAFITGYVLSGSIRSEVNDGKTQVFHAGEHWTEPHRRVSSYQRECGRYRTSESTRHLRRRHHRCRLPDHVQAAMKILECRRGVHYARMDVPSRPRNQGDLPGAARKTAKRAGVGYVEVRLPQPGASMRLFRPSGRDQVRAALIGAGFW